jgi:hypothetical protein
MGIKGHDSVCSFSKKILSFGTFLLMLRITLRMQIASPNTVFRRLFQPVKIGHRRNCLLWGVCSETGDYIEGPEKNLYFLFVRRTLKSQDRPKAAN